MDTMDTYIMSLDQGTTSSRCILFDKGGRICSMAQKEFAQIYPQPGWVEHDPMEIWSSQLSVAAEAMAKINVSAEQIKGIGITNQRETTIVWDAETGRPVYNAIVWQCRRTADRIEQLIKDGWEQRIRERTGLIPDAYFSATKIAWILEHVEGAAEKARDGRLRFGTVDSWLIWNLTKGKIHATDYTNASRTMLFDIRNLQWDRELLEYFQIPETMLPEVHPSSHLFGVTDVSFLGGAIPIAGAAGDQQAALFGQCCFEPGDVKNTYGTGCFLLMNTGDRIIDSASGLLTTIAATADGDVNYALEGSVFVAGAAIQWLRDGMELIRNAAESEHFAKQTADSDGMYLVPAFAGLGAPYWNPYARGTIVGITRGTTRAHFIRAALESIAYQSADLLQAMERDSGIDLRSLKVDGGASANDFLMQFQADVIDAETVRPSCIETTALGAAYLAGLAVGYWEDQAQIRANWKQDRTFTPAIDAGRRDGLLNGWHKAVKCALAWADN